ncbi:MAG: metallopeptidase TldD-related protein, partial [Aeromonas veronii]
ADAVSGDFSFGASGFLCRDGVRLQPVRGITVAGNFYRLLGELEAVGDTLHHNDGKGFYAPLIRFGGLSVAGK